MEVHSIGRFQLKGAAGPVDMVEMVLSHLAGRRLLLGQAGLPKSQKGKLLEPAQPESLIAAVNGIQLPGLGQLYRRQWEQQCAAAEASKAAAVVPVPHPGTQSHPAKQVMGHAGSDSRSISRQGSQRQLSFFARSPSVLAASAAALGVRAGSGTWAPQHNAANSNSSAVSAAQPQQSSTRMAGEQ
jgi:hypothetical protein